MANQYGEYTDEFRRQLAAETVAWAEEEAISMTRAAKKVAGEYGVHYNSVRSWVAAFFPDVVPAPVSSPGHARRRAAAEAAVAAIRGRIGAARDTLEAR